MDYMAGLPDKAFELACIDPPYGVDAGNMIMGKGKDKQWGASVTGIKRLLIIVFSKSFSGYQKNKLFGAGIIFLCL